MNKKYILVTIVTTLLFVTILVLVQQPSRLQPKLVSPNLGQFFGQKVISTPTPTSTPEPPNAPKSFKFDSSTDLNAELEKVSPQVLDSDFE